MFQLSCAYRKVDKMSIRVSLALEAREMFLTLHIGFSLERANFVCAFEESISGLDQVSTVCRSLDFSQKLDVSPFRLFNTV